MSDIYAYPVIFTEAENGFIDCYVPDFPLNTQGKNAADAIYMVRDAMGLTGICLEDMGKALPKPSAIKDVEINSKKSFVSLVDVDFVSYRKKAENRSVRRNVSLPAWLDEAATKADINVSGVVQVALKNALNIN